MLLAESIEGVLYCENTQLKFQLDISIAPVESYRSHLIFETSLALNSLLYIPKVMPLVRRK